MLNVPNDAYDIVLNRHESFNASELKRVLKENGIFITQQVRAYNNKDLATFFDPNHEDQFPDCTLEINEKELVNAGFEIIYKNEYYPKIKFLDLGAIAFFAKIIEWEFLNFSVKNSIDKFEILEQELKEKGYVESTEHRFIIIARKK